MISNASTESGYIVEVRIRERDDGWHVESALAGSGAVIGTVGPFDTFQEAHRAADDLIEMTVSQGGKIVRGRLQ